MGEVTLECPQCRANKNVPRPPDIPENVRLIELICPDCDAKAVIDAVLDGGG